MPSRLLAGALALSLLLAACASSDDGGDAALDRDTASATTETTASQTTTSTTVAPTTTTTAPPDELPTAAGDPEGLARQIIETEGAIRAPGAQADDLADEAHLQQVAYRRLSSTPAWDTAVLERLPPELRPVAEANVAAGRELRQLVRRPRSELPAWRIVAPAPADELLRHYRDAEAEFGVPWAYLAAINLTETRMGRLRGTSTAGAQGPMQFLPSTWEAYGLGGDINDTRDAIRGAANYLRANGAPADIDNALYRYNPTPRYVNAVKLYAQQMLADERAFYGYYGWQVYYVSTLGDVLLPVGYERTEPRPVTPDDVPVARS